MGKEEIENFPLRVFIFFLKGKYIFPMQHMDVADS